MTTDTANPGATADTTVQDQAVKPVVVQVKKLGWKKVATIAGVGVVVGIGAVFGAKLLRKPAAAAAQAVADAAQSAADAAAPSA